MKKVYVVFCVAVIVMLTMAGCSSEKIEGESEVIKISKQTSRKLIDPTPVDFFCWDTNLNGLFDEEEDIDGNGHFGPEDCRGANGLQCWDTVSDSECSPEEASIAEPNDQCDVMDCRGSEGVDGVDGKNCYGEQDVDGCLIIICGDTEYGPICSGDDGIDGTNGTSCDAVQDADNCLVVTCGTIAYDPICPGTDGVDGTNGSDGSDAAVMRCRNLPLATDDFCRNGGYERQCGHDINENGVLDDDEVDPSDVSFLCHGENGADAEPCTVIDNADGTYTMTCPDGTSTTWNDGETGPQGSTGENGADAEPCTVVQEAGLCEMTCPDGTSANWVCEEPVDPITFDNDGDCYCGSDVECVGSVNPACDTILTGDCSDDGSGATYWGCYNPATDESEVVELAIGCPVGYGVFFLTDQSYFINPNIIEIPDNGVDDNCDGNVDDACVVHDDCPVDELCNIDTCEVPICSDDIDCDDSNECTDNACMTPFMCINPPVAEGTECGTGMFCDGAGECAYECIVDDDCAANETCTNANMCQIVVPGCVDDADCDDDVYCNGFETCNAGICEVGVAVGCIEGYSCSNADEDCVADVRPLFSMEVDAESVNQGIVYRADYGLEVTATAVAGMNDSPMTEGHGSIVFVTPTHRPAFCMCHQDGYTPWECAELFTGAYGCGTQGTGLPELPPTPPAPAPMSIQ